MKLKPILARMARMSEPAWYIFRSSMLLSLTLLCCGLLLTFGGYEQHRIAEAIYETVEAVLLIGILFSVIVEDQQSSR